jgi:NADH/NAD ratio-sensing transcriptional regulator Rex
MLFSQYSFASVKNATLIDNKVATVEFFVDRVDDIRKVLQNLQMHKIVSLVGVTNIGKTEILRKYAYDNQNKYELIWFFDTSLDLNEQFASLAKKINQTLLLTSKEKVSEDADFAQEDVINFLTRRKNWLLVFDNLSLNQNHRVMNIINWDHNGHIIISSQDSKNLPNNMYIHRLDRNNSLILLQKILGNKPEHKKVFEQLIEIFKGYPGSIVQGALLLKENRYLSIEEYKSIVAQSLNPLGKHMELILNLLSNDDKKLLLQIALLNNQNFSKNLLSLLADNPDSVGVALYNLNRFGLIKNITAKDDMSLFEMHDAIRDEVLKLTTKEKIKEEISSIISKLSLVLPKGVAGSQLFITNDKTIQTSLEILLKNAEKYKTDIDKILGLRRNLIIYYMSSLDYYNVEKMKIWLEQNEKNLALLSSNMSDEQKVNYAWYLLYIGIIYQTMQAPYLTIIRQKL